jgi:hypothetical protein
LASLLQSREDVSAKRDVAKLVVISNMSIQAAASRSMSSLINSSTDHGFNVAYANYDMIIRGFTEIEKRLFDIFPKGCAHSLIDPATIRHL